MMISDLHPDVVRAHLRELVRCYYGALVKARDGKENIPEYYTEERVFRDVLRGGVEKWSCLFSLISGMSAFPDAGMIYFQRNLEAWMKFADEVLPAEERMFSLKSLVVIR
jgi:hypothetical protein